MTSCRWRSTRWVRQASTLRGVVPRAGGDALGEPGCPALSCSHRPSAAMTTMLLCRCSMVFILANTRKVQQYCVDRVSFASWALLVPATFCLVSLAHIYRLSDRYISLPAYLPPTTQQRPSTRSTSETQPVRVRASPMNSAPQRLVQEFVRIRQSREQDREAILLSLLSR